MTKTHKGRKDAVPTGATAASASPSVSVAPPRPAWLVLGSLALALVGLLVSAYLTYEHFTDSTSLACPEGATVNCAKVTSSSYATFLGMPVALLGLAYFVVLVAMCLPAAWRSPRLDVPRLALAGVGVAMVVYLVWAELFGIGAICLWCTVIHVVQVLLLGLLLVGWALAPRR